MPKELRCAKCGKLLAHSLKAIPQQGRVITVVEPHECSEKVEELDFSSIVEPARKDTKRNRKDLDSFPFTQSIKKATDEVDISFTSKDRRAPRDEKLDSSAPAGVRDLVKGKTLSRDPREMEREPEDYDGGEEMGG